ncbi:MAG TPA: hypothetical protein VGF59_34765 [Bryobacteraceae bacterium]|jgi:hypothetical protein
MRTNILLLATLLLGSWAVPAADSAPDSNNGPAAAFSRLKMLVGEWEAESEGRKVHLSYELIAGGTALVERDTGERMAPMLTVYHIDGQRLMLTHYCMAGNQPRMVAGPLDAKTGEIEFRFLDATNLASPNAGHMHHARMRVIDNDHLESEWNYYEDGKLKMTEKALYTRVK